MRHVATTRYGSVYVGPEPDDPWLIENASYPQGRLLKDTVAATSQAVPTWRAIARRAFLSTASGGSYYVFLGATYEPHARKHLAIRTFVSANDDIGLGAWLAEPVHASALATATALAGALAPGVLSFRYANTHAVDSKAAKYAEAAAQIVRMLEPQFVHASDDMVRDLFIES